MFICNKYQTQSLIWLGIAVVVTPISIGHRCISKTLLILQVNRLVSMMPVICV